MNCDHHSLESRGSPFFIMGSQRSGTTLLSMVLDAHPQIAVIDEDDTNFHVFQNITYLLDFDQVKTFRRKNGLLLGYKAPRDTHRTDELFRTVENARVLWIVRPVEQVVASMCELRIESASWALTHAPREVRKYVLEFPEDTTMADAFYAVSSEHIPRRKEILLATLCWISKERCRKYAVEKHRNRVFCIQYTDLVLYTKKVTGEICKFLNIYWHPSLLNHHRINRGEKIGGSVTERPVDTRSISKWERSLSHDDLTLLYHTVGHFFGELLGSRQTLN